MATSFGNKTKKGRIKMFLFFLLLSVLFWSLTKFSREYTATVSATITYENLPDHFVLNKANLKEISFDLTANGFEFLVLKFKKPSILVDVSSFSEDEQNLIIQREELTKLVSGQLKTNVSVKNILPNQLRVLLDKMATKMVPIKVEIIDAYQDGYRPVGEIQLRPDSTLVSGPSDIIDTINYIPTKKFSVKNVNASILEDIELNTNGLEDVMVGAEITQLQINVAEFTQKELVIPIEVLNVPDDIQIKILPEFCEITFNVSLADFNAISENNFKVTCDYSERNEQGNFMIPTLSRSPEHVLNVEIKQRKIDYLIFKQ